MKRKLLFFIESLSGGGAEQVLVTLLRHFDYEKYDVTLMTVSDVGVHLDDIDFTKVHYCTLIPHKQNVVTSLWYRTKYKLLYQWLPASLVAWLIMPKDIDTYIAFIEGYCTKIISNVSASKHKIAYVHIDLQKFPWTLEKGIYQSMDEERNIYKKFESVVCVSRSVERVMQKFYGLNNTAMIYNPIDVKHICQMAQEKIKFQPSSGFNIVSVGRLVPQKGYDILLPIIARLRKNGVNAVLYILGEGEERLHLEQQISELSLQESVFLMGYCSNPHAIVSKMDLFVCSSRAEGYSLVIAEALSVGVPVISTNCSGPNELLADNMYGVLCEDYDQLYEQIRTIATNPVLRAELCQKALHRRNSLDVEKSMEQLYQLLKY